MSTRKTRDVALATALFLISGFAGSALQAAGTEQWLADLNSADASTQISAARALGAAKEKKAIQPLISLLSNTTDASVGASAAAALGAIREKGESTVALLRAGKENDHARVRYAALLALANLRDGDHKAEALEFATTCEQSNDELLQDLARKVRSVFEG